MWGLGGAQKGTERHLGGGRVSAGHRVGGLGGGQSRGQGPTVMGGWAVAWGGGGLWLMGPYIGPHLGRGGGQIQHPLG